MIEWYNHQTETIEFQLPRPRSLNTSSPGTGKTLSSIETFQRRNDGKYIICSPATIMDPAWGREFRNNYPDVQYGIIDRPAIRKNPRALERLFDENDVVMINPESAKLVLDNIDLDAKGYSGLILDEFTVAKNRKAQRSQALAELAERMTYALLLSGTPTPNGILDIWHPMYMVDGGQRLGRNFFAFRSAVCNPSSQQFGARTITRWEQIPGAEEMVADFIRDINIRFALEEVVDMPPRINNIISVPMPDKLRNAYDTMATHAMLELEAGEVSAIHRGILVQKLLQIASGSVYGEEGKAHLIDLGKYQLIRQLVMERFQSLVFFTWGHQRDALAHLFEEEDIRFAVIDGSVKLQERNQIVADFQAGRYRTLLIQYQAGSHGLTLTKSTASIFCSPTHNLEHFEQANHRDYRLGQTLPTEMIMVHYEGTVEEQVYQNLMNKRNILKNLLNILRDARLQSR